MQIEINCGSSSELKNKAYFFLGLVILLWGLNYIIGRILSSDETPLFNYIHISGIFYGFLRYLVGSVTMIFIILYQKKGIKTITKEITPYYKILLLSAVISAIFVLGAHMSHEYISGGTTSIIINLCPILVFLYSIRFMKDEITKLKLLGFILGSIGGGLFLINSIIDNNSDSTIIIGIFLAIIAMLAWGGYTIILQYLEGADRYIVMTVKHIVSTLFIIPFIFIYVSDPLNNLILVLDVWTLLGIVYAGVFASGLAYLLYFKVIEILGASKASSFLFLIPFVSVVGDILLNELPTMLTIIGGLIAIVGVGIIKKSANNSK